MSNYPDSADIRKIKKWPYDDFKGLIEFVRPLVEPMGRVTVKRGGRVEIATGGWSGNEEIMGAIRSNYMIWSGYWKESHRGGLTVFDQAMFKPSHKEARQ